MRVFLNLFVFTFGIENICLVLKLYLSLSLRVGSKMLQARGGGEALPYMGYIGMCRCEGYGFQAVYSRIGYINQSVWV